MPKDDNYFEEAMALCRDPDPNVSLLAESLYRQMLEENRQRGRSPVGEFNILYFVQSAIRVWLSRHPDATLADTQFPLESEPINGVNWPESVAADGAMIREFVELVEADSVPEGDEFDVAYAVEMISLAFDGDGELRSPPSAKSAEDDFDDWLSGFNNDQTPVPPFGKSDKSSKRVKS